MWYSAVFKDLIVQKKETKITSQEHDEFNKFTFLMLFLQLRRKSGRCAALNEFVDVACLPTGLSQFPAGHKCKIVGWGQTQSDSKY